MLEEIPPSRRQRAGRLVVVALVGVFMASGVGMMLHDVISSLAVAPPNLIPYQGRVLNSNGVPVAAASADMQFRLYDSLAAGTCLWSNASATCDSNADLAVTLTDGLFSENLGDTGAGYAAIADSVFADDASVFLEVQVEGETLSPRKRLGAAAYALNANTVDGLDSGDFFQQGGNSYGITATIGTNDTEDFQIETDGTARVTVLSTGEVAIGTASPLDLLSLDGTSGPMSGSTGIGIDDNSVVAGGNTYIILNHLVATDGEEQLLMNGDSSTGLNITNQNSATANTDLTDIPSSANFYTNSGNSGGLVFASQHATAPMIFATGGVATGNERLRIDSAGNVGIGTTTPGETLEVAGTSYVSGHMAVGADALIDDGSLLYPGSTYSNVLNVSETVTDATSDYVEGFTNYFLYDPSADASSVWAIALDSEAVTEATNAEDVDVLTSGYFNTSHRGTGAITSWMSGIEAYAYTTATSGSSLASYAGSFTLDVRDARSSGTENDYGLYSAVYRIGATGGTINTYGVYVDDYGVDNAGAGTSTAYGLYLEDFPSADAQYAIYSEGGDSYLAGNLGIGTATPGEKLAVVGTADVSGHVAIGADAAVNDVSLLYGAVTIDNVLNVSEEITTASTDYVEGITSHVLYNPSADASGVSVNAVDGNVYTDAGNAQNIDIITGGQFSANHQGTGSITGWTNGIFAYAGTTPTSGSSPINMAGYFSAFVEDPRSSGTENTYGLNVLVKRTGATGGTVNTYGVYVDNNTVDNAGAGTANFYGLYLENITGADTNYALYSAGGQSYHAGNFGIGATSPDADLDIEAAEDTERIRLTDSSNADSVGIYVGDGTAGLDGTLSAQAGSLFLDEDGKLWVNVNGATDWSEVAYSTGAVNDLDGVYDTDSDKVLAIDNVAGLKFDAVSGDFTVRDSGSVTFATFTTGGNVAFENDVDLGSSTADTISMNGYLDTGLVPTTDGTLDLGSTGNRWGDLFLDGATLHVGDAADDEFTVAYNAATNLTSLNSDGTAGEFAFLSADTERVRIDGSGNVGIGDTTPAAALTVGSGDLFQVNSSGAIAAATGYAQGSGDFAATLTTANDATFASTTASSDTISIKPQTATATATFDGQVTSADLTAARTWTFQDASGTVAFLSDLSSFGDITAVGSMASGDAFAGTGADDDWLGLGSGAGRIEFDDQATDEVNILSANVGIGTSTPGALLSVGSGDRFKVNSDGDITSSFTQLDGTDLANGAGAATTTLVLDDTTGFNAGNYVLVNSTYAKIVSVDSGTNLTISPALTWSDNDPVDEYHLPEVGGTDTASTLANRYGRGYFVDGMVTGNGSTRFSDNLIDTTAGTFGFNTGNNRPVTFGTGLVTLGGNLAVTGTITSGGAAAYVNGGNSFAAAAVLGTNDSNTLALETGGTTRLTIDTSGNVGIGTAGPGQKLDVQGTADTAIRVKTTSGITDAALELDRNVQGNARSIVRLQTGGVTDWFFGLFNYGAADPGGSDLQLSSTGQSDGNSQFTFTKTGRVGIGTDDPSQMLSIGASGTPLEFEGATADGFETTFAITDPTADRTITFQDGTGTVAFTSDIPAAGANTTLSNLGSTAINAHLIPDSDDDTDLGSASLRWQDLYLGPGTLHIGTSATNEGTISYTAGTSLNFGTDSTTNADIAFFTDDLYLDKSTGFVGIGDTTPDALLDVAGTFQTDGNAVIGDAATDRLTVTGELLLGSVSADPTGANGLMFYNTTSNTFRCYENAAWKDCIGTGGSGDITAVGDVTSGVAFDGTQGNSLQFEGSSVDGFETTLTAANPGADYTVTIPAATITLNAAGDLSGTTLNSGVVTSSLTSVGALASGSITSGFGSIDTGADDIVTTGTMGSVGITSFTGGTGTFAGNFSAVGLNLTFGDAVTDNFTLAAAVQGTSALIFDGSTNDTNETAFAITDPTADRTITFQNASGTVAFTSDIPASGANTALSNLGSTAINAHLIPDSNDDTDLGSASLRWQDLYLGPGTLHIGTSATNEGTISYTAGTSLNFGTDSTANADIAFFTDDLYLDKSEGFLGIGDTTPETTLSVDGYVHIDPGGANANLPNIPLVVYGAGSEVVDFRTSGGTSGLSISSGGAVTINSAIYGASGTLYSTSDIGLNDASPDAQLDVLTSGASDGILIDNNAATGDPILGFQLSGVSQFTVGVDDSDSDYFKISNGSSLGTNDRFVMSSSGYIGIGTTPTAGILMDFTDAAGGTAVRTTANDTGYPFYSRNSSAANATQFYVQNSGATTYVANNRGPLDIFPAATYGVNVSVNGSGGVFTVTDSTNGQVFYVDYTGLGAFDQDLYVGAASAADDDYLYFDYLSAEYIRWDNTTGLFDMSDDLVVDIGLSSGGNALCHTSAGTGTDQRIQDCATAPSADYREQYPTESAAAVGDIVVAGASIVTTTDGDDMRQMVRSFSAYQPGITGIISDQTESTDFNTIGYNISEADNPQPVALNGRVMTKVNIENGAIAAGDPITSSSTAGVGMRATQPGMVVGYALDDWAGPGQGTVMVFVSPGFHMGEAIAQGPTGDASSGTPGMDSFGLALRGSGWDGAAAQATAMKLVTDVTDATTYKLSVRNQSDTEVAYITDDGVMSVASDMVVGGKLYPSALGVAQTSAYVYYGGAGDDFMRTNATGWGTGSYDFAEMFPSSQPLEPGDVVAFDTVSQQVKKASGDDRTRLAGIVSTRPGFLAGDKKEGDSPVALAGRVPTNVSVENGTISVGDALTVSETRPGFAMKATEPGQIVGYALEDASEDGSAIVFVHLGYWTDGTQPTAGTDNAASGFSPSNVSSLSMNGNVYMQGNSILDVGAIAGLGGIWSVDAEGTFRTEGTFKTVIESYQGEQVDTAAVTSPDVQVTLIGTATLENGIATVSFESVSPSFNDITSTTAPVRVLVTPSGPVSLYVEQKDHNGFTVRQVGGTDSGVSFDWMVSAYRKDYEPAVGSLQEAVGEEPPVVEEPVPTEPAPEPVPDPVPPEEPAPAPTEVPAPEPPLADEPLVTTETPSEPAP